MKRGISIFLIVLMISLVIFLTSCENLVGEAFRQKSLPAYQEKCSDSDSGINLEEKGTTKGLMLLRDGTKKPTAKSDECKNGKLIEYYCSRDLIKSSVKSCPSDTFCFDGECQNLKHAKKSCTKNGECYSDFCFNGICSGSVGSQCDSSGSGPGCDQGLECGDPHAMGGEYCYGFSGTECTQDYLCYSNWCYNGICKGGVGDQCDPFEIEVLCDPGLSCVGQGICKEPFIGDGSYTMTIGDEIIADNGIGLKLVNIYPIMGDYLAEKGISFDFYIGNDKINSFTIHYALKQYNLDYFEQPEVLELIDFGLKININKLEVTDNQLNIVVESYEDEIFNNCNQLYNLCLDHKAEDFLAPMRCTKYCNDIQEIEGYKMAKDGKFLIIAQPSFDQEVVEELLDYSKLIYGVVEEHLEYKQVTNNNVNIYIGEFGGPSSRSETPGIFVRANNYQGIYSGEYLFKTDLVHEMIHSFNDHTILEGGILEESYTRYNTVLMGYNLGQIVFECKDDEYCTDWGYPGSIYECGPHDPKKPTCFWNELDSNYPDVYDSIVDDLKEKRLILDNSLYCFGDKIKSMLPLEFYEYLKEKYLEEAQGVSGGEMCVRIWDGAPFHDYWD